MTTDTVLTGEVIEEISRAISAVLSEGNITFRAGDLIWNQSLARAIEQAVLQSPEVLRLREDEKRLDWLDATNAPFKMGWRFGIAPAGNVHPYAVIQLYGALTTVREGIDAAMEKQL